MVAKGTLISQKGKYEGALSDVKSAITELKDIKNILSDKSKFCGVSKIDTIIGDLENALSDLEATQKRLASTVSVLDKKINEYDEDQQNN